jgi:RNA polymerase sigma-70 factor (ECF subfamily)
MSGPNSHSQELDESQLIRRAKAGDAEAFGELYTRHIQAVFRFFFARLDNREDAEDLTEEAFFRVWRSLPTFEDQGVPFLAYLFLVARNLLIDHYRRFENSKTSAGIEDSVMAESGADTSETAIRNIEHKEIRQALDKLKDDYQIVLVSRFLSELSTKEIAQIMGKTPGSIRVLQHRALQALGRLIT